jgi:DnaJ-class molecular chaperone
MNKLRSHSCKSCKGTGKVVGQRTRMVYGVKQTCEFLVDCPGKLTEVFLLSHPEIGSGKKAWSG